MLSARGEFPDAVLSELIGKGSFDCVIVHFVYDHFAQDDSE